MCRWVFCGGDLSKFVYRHMNGPERNCKSFGFESLFWAEEKNFSENLFINGGHLFRGMVPLHDGTRMAPILDEVGHLGLARPIT